LLQPGFVGGGILNDIGYQNAFGIFIEAEMRGKCRSQVLYLNTKETTDNASAFNKLVINGFSHIDGDGKADTHIAATATDDKGVNADYLSIKIEQRPAGIAGIYGGIGLDEIFISGEAEPASALSTYDAGSNGMAQVEGVADGKDPFANLEGVGVGQFKVGQVIAIDFYYSNIRFGVGTDNLCFNLRFFSELNGNFVGFADQMVIRQDVAIGRYNKSGALGELGRFRLR